MTAAHFAAAASRAAAGWRLGGETGGSETGLHLLVTEPTHVSRTGCSAPVLTTFGLKKTLNKNSKRKAISVTAAPSG